jgi:hypothetical protein
MSPTYCHDCTRPLTSEEAYYYGTRCEKCERTHFERIELWRHGGTDPELDAFYSQPNRETSPDE